MSASPWALVAQLALERVLARGPGSPFRDVRVQSDGSVAVDVRVRPRDRALWAERAERAERELERFVREGTPPSRDVISWLSERQWAHVQQVASITPLPPPETVEPQPGGGPAAPKQPWRPPTRGEKRPPDSAESPPETDAGPPWAVFGTDALVEGGVQRSPPGPEFFMPKSIPGGAFGMAQQVPATIARIRPTWATGNRRKVGRPRRRGRPRKHAKPRSTGRRKARLVKGSAAAKAHMARLRKMRRK